MTRDTLTRAAVEAAEPLSFDEAADLALVSLTYHGVEVRINLRAFNAGMLVDLERRIDRMLSREGWNAPASAAPSAPQKAPRRPAVEPWYNDAGEACCPVHKRPLKQGQYGAYCSAKDDTQPCGYCSLKFAE
jgi:hypothetical protein